MTTNSNDNMNGTKKILKNILLIGASGMLGLSILDNIDDSEINIMTPTSKDVDITNIDSIREFVKNIEFDTLINCAAYTKVDQAEIEKELCLNLNVQGPYNLAIICKENNATMIHISSDYVYSGDSKIPYAEETAGYCVNFYGETKLEGENKVLDVLKGNSVIIRTSWLYSKTHGKNFYKTILNLARTRDTLNIVSDQYGTPTLADDLARMILSFTLDDKTFNSDEGQVFNFSNEGQCSWYDFASRIVEVNSINCKVLPVSTSEFPTIARRPTYSVMDKSKITKVFQRSINHWEMM